jgi:hypothetical protein
MQLLFTISLNMIAYHIPLTAVMLRSVVKEMLFIMPAVTQCVTDRQTTSYLASILCHRVCV